MAVEKTLEERLRERYQAALKTGLSDEVPPRPVEKDLIRKYLRHQLPPKEYHDVQDLIADYRAWHDAKMEILRTEPRILAPREVREQYGDKDCALESEHESNVEPRPSVKPLQPRVSSSTHWRVMAAIGTAACLVMIVGVMWFNRPGTIQVRDGIAMVTIGRNGDITGLDGYPKGEKDTLCEVLTSKSFEYPVVFDEMSKEIGEKSAGRGSYDVLQYPVGITVISDQPTFRWNEFTAVISYRIVIRDAELKDIDSGVTTSNSWQAQKPLQRGRSYTWQIFAKTNDGRELVAPTSRMPKAKFHVLSEVRVKELNDRIAAASGSHLLKVVIYVQFGLLDLAEEELSMLEKENPDARLVRELQQQLLDLRQRAP